MKARKTCQGLLLMMGLICVGGSGCQWFDRNRPPTTPALPGDAAMLANWAAMEGVSDNFGVFNGDGFFQIQTPAGEYLLEYRTNLGTFYLVFRARRAARLMVGLQPGDQAQTGRVYRGTITASNPAAGAGNVTVFYQPGSPGNWEAVFAKDGSDAIRLIDGVGANYTPGQGALELFLPKIGKYRLFYTTTLGSFEYPFATTEKNAVVTIGLSAGDTIRDASLQTE